MKKTLFRFTAALFIFLCVIKSGCDEEITNNDDGLDISACDQYGALPIRTVYPVTLPILCEDGTRLTYQQGSTLRYACLNYPDQADTSDHKWPMIVYIHGSLVTPSSLYLEGRDFFNLRNTFQLSNDVDVNGFIILSPEGRIAKPWKGNGPATGEGFHWDEWYRNPQENLDAKAIDHFIDSVISLGKVDTNRIYVYGWSNGAYMTVLYSSWRSSRIAAMGQYAGANPWSRTPCPIAMTYNRQVPLFLLRNLCDALVPCSTTNQWLDTLRARNWPFKHHSLDGVGEITLSDSCSTNSDCSGNTGLAEHFRWPRTTPFELMLEYFRMHPLN